MSVPHGMVQRLRDAGVPEETARAVGEMLSDRAGLRRDYELEMGKLWDEVGAMKRRTNAAVAFTGGMVVGAVVLVAGAGSVLLASAG